MPSSFSVLLIIIAIMAVLTWIIPAGQYKVDDAGAIIAGSYESVKAHPQGIWDVLMAQSMPCLVKHQPVQRLT